MAPLGIRIIRFPGRGYDIAINTINKEYEHLWQVSVLPSIEKLDGGGSCPVGEVVLRWDAGKSGIGFLSYSGPFLRGIQADGTWRTDRSHRPYLEGNMC